MTKKVSLLGRVQPDPVGQLLHTGYMRFYSPFGIDGLAKTKPDRLDLLAVFADRPGTGQFRRFIAQAKLEYKTICIWHIANPVLESVLARYGFNPETEIQGDGEAIAGRRWDAINNQETKE